ncbi:periplasmic binding protein [Syntrophobotulus glycolicus DSM 8271]|uniref:Periplasmic binding protein n=1 Tax=Syntrophobotulus glycolicus (strain DSM 8271 / FlGlyR) TaxID=645991 RepID=F0T0Z5_SYNGF|nr:iron ABC transporter substrate-binding protein [Syntrophobotulus glycolicus]ADY57366.1 periplasmic binding protein [Syntrophobotulus glycolicus DSM 8271]
MRRKSAVSLLALFLLVTLMLNGCSNHNRTESAATSQMTVEDLLGRQVELTAPVEKVVAIGPGALRLYCYINGDSKLVGIEQMEKDSPTGRAYYLAYPSLAELPVIGPGGPNNAPDPEKLLAVKPDVIFDTYTTDQAAVDALQAKTGIPVVAVSYGKASAFDQDVSKSLQLIGRICGQEQKARDLTAYIEKCRGDLDERTKNIPDSERPTAYVGGLGARGTHGIESTQGKYSLFEAVHAKNVADEAGKSGSFMVDKEKLIAWNPDKIFLDLAGFAMVQEDYRKNPQFYQSLAAVKNGEVYSQMPYNYYTTNIETAIADAYYIGKVLYPEQFKDIEPEKKADELYQTFVGEKLYARMAEDFGGFKKLTLQ